MAKKCSVCKRVHESNGDIIKCTFDYHAAKDGEDHARRVVKLVFGVEV